MGKFLKIFLRTVLLLFLLLNIVVAFHAYKFTHFYENGSITLKAQADKSGWDKTKEILFGINAQKQKNAVVTDSVYEIVYLKTKSNLKLEGWYIEADSAVGTVCLFHGHGGTKSGVSKEAAEFRKLGYNTLLIDFRAHGNSEGNTCTIGYNEAEDVKLAYEFVKGRGEKNIVLWGISMGASAVTKAISDYGLEPAKVILEMPFGTIEDAVKGRVKMMGLPAQPISTLLTFWGGTENGFWAFEMKPQEYVKDIECPVLLQWGSMDPRVTRAEEERLFSNIINNNKKWVVFENSGHESLCKSETTKWVNEISGFLK